jgi:hypothetical protein
VKRKAILAAIATIAVLSAATPAYAAPAPDDTGVAAPPITARYGPKAKPPPLGAVAATQDRFGTAATVQYLYAQAAQTTTNGGGFAWFDVARPSLSTSDSHTLAELAVSSADRRQIVEVGWTVDRSLFGDADPHLFVFHWVDGVGTCYNGCGFVPTTGGGGPAGKKLTPGTAQYLTIRQSTSGWWISADGIGWLGYFPHSLWGGRFTQAGIVQWFGEVAAFSTTPCTDMGNGAFGSATSATRIYNIGLWDTTTTPNIATGHTHPSYYTAFRVNSREMRYGGPGAC